MTGDAVRFHLLTALGGEISRVVRLNGRDAVGLPRANV